MTVAYACCLLQITTTTKLIFSLATALCTRFVINVSVKEIYLSICRFQNTDLVPFGHAQMCDTNRNIHMLHYIDLSLLRKALILLIIGNRLLKLTHISTSTINIVTLQLMQSANSLYETYSMQYMCLRRCGIEEGLSVHRK